MFVKGFYAYEQQQFSKFEFEKSFVVFDQQEEKQIHGLFDNEKVNTAYHKTVSDYAILKDNECTYDGIISSEYKQIASLHPKGFFLNIIPRNNAAIHVMFCAFLFRNVMLIDNPVLSELMTMNYYTQHASRKSSKTLAKFPCGQSHASPDVYEEIYKTMELDNILRHINDRQRQMEMFDYCSIWSAHNESFFKIKPSRFNIGDILDFSTIEFPNSDNNNENKDSNP